MSGLSGRSRPRHTWLRWLTVLGLVVSGGALVGPAASAHPGHPEHEAAAAAIPAGDYQQVQLALGSAELGEAMSLAVLPDRAVVHTARDGTVRYTDAAGNTKTSKQAGRLHARRGGPPGYSRRPGLRLQPLSVPVLLTQAQHPGGDAPSRAAPPRSRRGRGISTCPASPSGPTAPSTWQARKSCSKSPTTVASAVTWAATSTSTLLGTST